MTRSLKYSWPVFAYLVFQVLAMLVQYEILPYTKVIDDLSTLLFTIAGIYYLYISPFGETHFLPLSTLLVIRYFIPIMMPFTLITGISFYMGINMIILFFYALRTRNKEPIRKIDYTKLLLLSGFILLQIAMYAGLLFLNNYPTESLAYTRETYLAGIRYMGFASRLIALGLVLVHLWQMGKWEKDLLDESEMELIDMIGKKAPE